MIEAKDPSDLFTVEDLQRMVEQLRLANVPPFRCGCGREWYCYLSSGWKVGDGVFFKCECGATYEAPVKT